jgi:hypothetical protein
MLEDRDQMSSQTVGARQAPPALWLFLGGFSLVLLGFVAGKLSTPIDVEVFRPIPATMHESDRTLIQGFNEMDPRELIPLPGPGSGQGMQPSEGECPLLFYQDGQFYRLDPPGGGMDGSPELFPLEPLPGPLIPPRQSSPPVLDPLFTQRTPESTPMLRLGS